MKPCGRHIDLLRFLDNDLGEQEAQQFSAHLETCAHCQSRLEQERVLSQFLRESRPLYSAPTDLRVRVAAAIEQRSSEQRRQWNPWRQGSPVALGLKTFATATLMIALSLIAVPNVMQNVRAANYAETAAKNHNKYLNHELRPGIDTNSPEAVTAWFVDKVPFQFRLPSSETALDATPNYQLVGASLVEYRGTPAALVLYKARSGMISLMVESGKAAVIAGGEEIRNGALTFHYRNEGELKVITWSAHNLSYALVSSIKTSPHESCMVCHQTMVDHEKFFTPR
jgi:anti-sigma factor (TIGR02949 family)